MPADSDPAPWIAGAAGKNSARVSASYSALSGKSTKPFSIVTLSACIRLILSPYGETRVAREQPVPMRFWQWDFSPVSLITAFAAHLFQVDCCL